MHSDGNNTVITIIYLKENIGVTMAHDHNYMQLLFHVQKLLKGSTRASKNNNTIITQLLPVFGIIWYMPKITLNYYLVCRIIYSVGVVCPKVH